MVETRRQSAFLVMSGEFGFGWESGSTYASLGIGLRENIPKLPLDQGPVIN